MRRFKNVIVYIALLLSFLGFSSFFLPMETIQIRIFSHLKVSAVNVSIYTGSYKLMADDFFSSLYKQGIDCRIEMKGDSIEVKQNERVLGTFKYIKFYGNEGSELKVKLINPDRKLRNYQENLSFAIVEGSIRIINEIELDNYIAGVTEAEAGSRSALEFYKVQAILARTFALAHINKHVSEGFSLCDQVHCQAYFGRPRDLSIYKAIAETKGLVVVDENLNLIVAAFHSNSGGETCNSEDVWGSKTSYLRSVPDSFSLKMPNARWERRMLADDWLSYLKLKHNYPSDEKEAKEAAMNFTQDSRKVYLECNTSKVPLKNVRLDLQLKSTFFNISPIGSDSIIFRGKGYGHGLGMCQEGAMRMVKLGYKYPEILNFYYKDIQLIDLHKLNFFKDE
ncbi:MAG: SpoIID/LytB domain-containing protein [bacterium]|nr:SpoIID/LytB domain-containing protein [bacterium]